MFAECKDSLYIDDMETNTEGDDKQWLILGLSSSKLSELNENPYAHSTEDKFTHS